MRIREAQIHDLTKIVDIYNASIPSRLATADTAPVTVGAREPWFHEFAADKRPLWVAEQPWGVEAWLSLRSFYGRPAYRATVEVAVYVAPASQRQGLAARLLENALAQAPGWHIRTVLAFVFGHNAPSRELFRRFGFDDWGKLPRVAELDAIERDLVIMGRRVGAAA